MPELLIILTSNYLIENQFSHLPAHLLLIIYPHLISFRAAVSRRTFSRAFILFWPISMPREPKIQISHQCSALQCAHGII